ncbi:hypothetical protein TNCV_1809631 [Trichonephila clavipes]|nr:hypothetical protein TNCV_1809631 [Trichonephila clavipes]
MHKTELRIVLTTRVGITLIAIDRWTAKTIWGDRLKVLTRYEPADNPKEQLKLQNCLTLERTAPNHPQGVLPQNWGETELNRSVTCIVLKATTKDRPHLALWTGVVGLDLAFVGCGSPVVKVSDHGRSSSPVPLKTHRVRERCTFNLSRAQTFSRWCGS